MEGNFNARQYYILRSGENAATSRDEAREGLRVPAHTPAVLSSGRKAPQMRHTLFYPVALRPRFPRVAAQVLPSATRPRLFAGD